MSTHECGCVDGDDRPGLCGEHFLELLEELCEDES